MYQYRETVQQVVAHHTQRVPDRSQIVGPTPAFEQREVSKQALPLLRTGIAQTKFCKTGIEPGSDGLPRYREDLLVQPGPPTLCADSANRSVRFLR